MEMCRFFWVPYVWSIYPGLGLPFTNLIFLGLMINPKLAPDSMGLQDCKLSLLGATNEGNIRSVLNPRKVYEKRATAPRFFFDQSILFMSSRWRSLGLMLFGCLGGHIPISAPWIK